MNNLDLEIQTLDEKRQLRNLANAIKLADGFSLLFVRCNQRPRQKEIIEELKAQLDGCKIKTLLLEKQSEHLLDTLQEKLGDEKPDAIFVYGLENSFPKADEASESPFVVTLNHSRNSFKKVLDCPLVLFLPEYALSAIYHGATDFYSIRSGVYLFSAKAEETEKLISLHASPEVRELEGLSFEARRNRVVIIKELLAEYSSLPQSQQNFEKELYLKEKLAHLYRLLADYEKSIQIHKEIISYSRQVNNLPLLAENLDFLAGVYTDCKDYDNAVKFHEEALKLTEELVGSSHASYGATLNNLALAYKYKGKIDKSIELFKQALSLAERTLGVNDPNYATGLNNLAVVFGEQGRLDESINLFNQAVEIDIKTVGKKHPQYARDTGNLAMMYLKQENYQKALRLLEESYNIYLKTAGRSHVDTKIVQKHIEICKSKIKEKTILIVPYIK